jgi:hypothetical protein
MLFESLEIPQWLALHGITPGMRSKHARKMLWGGDSETLEGPPISFQFYTQYSQQHIDIADPEYATNTFLNWCESLPTKWCHVVYVHNLGFDLVSFFWNVKRELIATTSGEFSFALESESGTIWEIEGTYGAPTYCIMADEHRTRSIYLVDSWSYYQGSLAQAATQFCPHLPKLEAPKGLGHKRFTAADKHFAAYAMRDSEIAYFIGVHLEKLHEEFDITQSISVAQMASKVFKRHHVQAPIMLPDRTIIEASMYAYHGGKNNITVSPGYYRNVSSLDISSAYPDAMHSLPSFYHEELYTWYSARSFPGKTAFRVPDTGIYYVWGELKACPWPILFDAKFKRLKAGRVVKQATTGYELNEAIRSGEFKPTQIEGWYYDAEEDKSYPPMKDYVLDFYHRKEAEEDPPRRAMYKFLLNSLSGKYIQTRQKNRTPVFDLDAYDYVQVGDLTAGGLFHPFIAALITGHTRAKIHRIEHEIKAIHTATDGMFTRVFPGKLASMCSKGLGALVNEAFGDLLLIRNKCYILYSDEPGKKGAMPSRMLRGKWIIKYAKHGFQGDVYTMERLALTGARDYWVEKRNSLRDSENRGRVANNFERRPFKLAVEEIKLPPDLPLVSQELMTQHWWTTPEYSFPGKTD